jgi:hypothetical protein
MHPCPSCQYVLRLAWLSASATRLHQSRLNPLRSRQGLLRRWPSQRHDTHRRTRIVVPSTCLRRALRTARTSNHDTRRAGGSKPIHGSAGRRIAALDRLCDATGRSRASEGHPNTKPNHQQRCTTSDPYRGSHADSDAALNRDWRPQDCDSRSRRAIRGEHADAGSRAGASPCWTDRLEPLSGRRC